MQRWLNYISVLFIIPLLLSCSKSNPLDCFKNTGTITIEERQSTPFNYLILQNNVDVFLSSAPKYSIKVRAGKNILPGIKTELSNNTLIISNENSCNWVRSYESPIEVYLEMPELDSILYQSSGNVTSLNQFRSEYLKLDVIEGAGSINLWVDLHECMYNLSYGTTDLTVRGYSHIVHLYSDGYGPANLSQLDTEFAYINNSSTNDIRVRSNLSLQVTIRNVGDVYYSGNPETIGRDITGEGKLYKE